MSKITKTINEKSLLQEYEETLRIFSQEVNDLRLREQPQKVQQQEQQPKDQKDLKFQFKGRDHDRRDEESVKVDTSKMNDLPLKRK